MDGIKLRGVKRKASRCIKHQNFIEIGMTFLTGSGDSGVSYPQGIA